MAKGRKTGGRKAGTPNKLTREMREVLKSILEKEIEKLPELLASLKPERRAEIICRLLPFVLPQKMETEITGAKDIIIEFKK